MLVLIEGWAHCYYVYC